MIKQALQMLAVTVLINASVGCVTMAPGADQVKLTSEASAVAGCAAAGNVKAQNRSDILTVDSDLRNQAVGLSANVVFVTGMGEGVAYRCGKASSPAT